MTLKQFFQLAGGFLVALIFYSAPLLPIIKWPFVIVSAILGIALAFLPLEERPLERWIFAFFKAVYSPTMYFWKKTVIAPKFFQEESAVPAPAAASPEQDAALKTYLSSTPQKTGPLAKLEGAEQGFLTSLGGLFAGMMNQAGGAVPAGQTTPPAVEAKREFAIPQSAPVKVTQATAPHLVIEERKAQPVGVIPQITTQKVTPIVAGEEIVSTRQVQFSIDAAPPNPPSTPNVIVGQVVDRDRKIIEGAIMEIKNEMGRPIRALRSNKVGHFITVTPLENGRYTIVTDKEGFEFPPVNFDAAGSLIPPILVQGHRAAVPEQSTMQPTNPSTVHP